MIKVKAIFEDLLPALGYEYEFKSHCQYIVLSKYVVTGVILIFVTSAKLHLHDLYSHMSLMYNEIN